MVYYTIWYIFEDGMHMQILIGGVYGVSGGPWGGFGQTLRGWRGGVGGGGMHNDECMNNY